LWRGAAFAARITIAGELYGAVVNTIVGEVDGGARRNRTADLLNAIKKFLPNILKKQLNITIFESVLSLYYIKRTI